MRYSHETEETKVGQSRLDQMLLPTPVMLCFRAQEYNNIRSYMLLRYGVITST